MIKFIILMFFSIPLHAFSDIHQVEFATISEHIFTIDVVDQEEGTVFLNASKKLENGLQTICKVPIEHETYMSSWRATYHIDKTIYRIGENIYAIGIIISNSCRGSGADVTIEKLQLFKLESNQLKKVFSETLSESHQQWCCFEDERSISNEESKATLTISSEMTGGHYNLVLCTTKEESHDEDLAVDGIYQSISSTSSTDIFTKTFVWHDSKYNLGHQRHFQK